MISTALRLGLALVAALAGALAVAGSSAAEPPGLASKRAEAQTVLAEIEAVDMQLDRAVDAYNGATVRLEEIELGRIGSRCRTTLPRSTGTAGLSPAPSSFRETSSSSRARAQRHLRGRGTLRPFAHTGDVVKISSLYDSWYASTYVGARRL